MTSSKETNELYYRNILDAIPLPVILVDQDSLIVDVNDAGLRFLSKTRGGVLRLRGGAALNCVHSADSPGGCGSGLSCHDCTIHNAINDAYSGKVVHRRRTKAELVIGDSVKHVDLLVSASAISLAEAQLVLLTLEDVSELTSLRSIVPMCSHCKRIRDDAEYWQNVDVYIRNFLGVDVSHGICQRCLEELYPNYSNTGRDKNNGA